MNHLEIKQFIRDIDYIFDIHFHVEIPYQGLRDPETVPLVDIKGLIIKEKNYEAHLRFINVEDLCIDTIYQANPVTLDLIDREEEDGWQKRYELCDQDYETIRLLCDKVEIISVKESEITL